MCVLRGQSVKLCFAKYYWHTNDCKLKHETASISANFYQSSAFKLQCPHACSKVARVMAHFWYFWYTLVHLALLVYSGTLWRTALFHIVSLALCLIGQGQPHPCYGVAHPTNPSKSFQSLKPLHTPLVTAL